MELTLRRIVPVLLAAAVVALGASGCGADPITARRVDTAVGPTFANLYVLQQAQRGRSVAASSLKSSATCTRGGPSTPDRGPGDDWTCNVTWFVHGPDIPAVASYAVHVQTSGCYTADGDGPADLNGRQTIEAADGDSVLNPLWEFDGCFDIS